MLGIEYNLINIFSKFANIQACSFVEDDNTIFSLLEVGYFGPYLTIFDKENLLQFDVYYSDVTPRRWYKDVAILWGFTRKNGELHDSSSNFLQSWYLCIFIAMMQMGIYNQWFHLIKEKNEKNKTKLH